MSGRDFFAVAGRRRRRSSSSSVVAVVGPRRRPSSVISLFSPREGPLKKIKFSLFFKKLAIFLKFEIFGKMSGRDFLAVAVAVDGRRRRRSLPSSVVAVVRRPFSLQRSLPWTKKGRPSRGTVEKNQISAVFKNSQFFSNSGTFENNQIFAVFKKLAIDGDDRRRQNEFF